MYLSIDDENENQVSSSDIAKVNVVVEEIEEEIKLPTIKRDFVIKLKRLTPLEIQKYTQPAVKPDDKKKTKRNKKRSLEKNTNDFKTRSKRRKLNESISINLELLNGESEKCEVASLQPNQTEAHILNDACASSSKGDEISNTNIDSEAEAPILGDVFASSAKDIESSNRNVESK